MPEAKRPDPKRRTPASRPGKSAKSGDAKQGRPRARSRREARVSDSGPGSRPASVQDPKSGPKSTEESIKKSISESAELQSEQRLGSTARRAAILAALVCVLTLTIAGPVRTYFAQRTEMKQLQASETQLRAQIAELEQQKIKLGDPVYIAAQARERLGFVMPGDIPYQVQLPPGVQLPGAPDRGSATVPSSQPWYTSLWHTIADEPHGVSPPIVPGGEPITPAPGG